MNCTEFLEHLGDLLDGDGEIGMAQVCERHLQLCRRCACVFETTRKMISLYRNCEPPPVPGSIGDEGG
jgi:hypothetical protein